jgi:hypothetical protein
MRRASIRPTKDGPAAVAVGEGLVKDGNVVRGTVNGWRRGPDRGDEVDKRGWTMLLLLPPANERQVLGKGDWPNT